MKVSFNLLFLAALAGVRGSSAHDHEYHDGGPSALRGGVNYAHEERGGRGHDHERTDQRPRGDHPHEQKEREGNFIYGEVETRGEDGEVWDDPSMGEDGEVWDDVDPSMGEDGPGEVWDDVDPSMVEAQGDGEFIGELDGQFDGDFYDTEYMGEDLEEEYHVRSVNDYDSIVGKEELEESRLDVRGKNWNASPSARSKRVNSVSHKSEVKARIETPVSTKLGKKSSVTDKLTGESFDYSKAVEDRNGSVSKEARLTIPDDAFWTKKGVCNDGAGTWTKTFSGLSEAGCKAECHQGNNCKSFFYSESPIDGVNCVIHTANLYDIDWTTNKKDDFFLVICNYHVKGQFFDIEEAKAELGKCPTDTTQRMVVEVNNFVANKDPHTVGGQSQGAGPAAGFNKYWYGWNQINAMVDIAQQFVEGKKTFPGVIGCGWTYYHKNGNFFAVICGGEIKGQFDSVEAAKEVLNKCPQDTTTQRMVVEVNNFVANKDPHTVGGQSQGAGPAAGFNKYWYGWTSINAMVATVQAFVDVEVSLPTGKQNNEIPTHDISILVENIKILDCYDGWEASPSCEVHGYIKTYGSKSESTGQPNFWTKTEDEAGGSSGYKDGQAITIGQLKEYLNMKPWDWFYMQSQLYEEDKGGDDNFGFKQKKYTVQEIIDAPKDHSGYVKGKFTHTSSDTSGKYEVNYRILVSDNPVYRYNKFETPYTGPKKVTFKSVQCIIPANGTDVFGKILIGLLVVIAIAAAAAIAAVAAGAASGFASVVASAGTMNSAVFSAALSGLTVGAKTAMGSAMYVAAAKAVALEVLFLLPEADKVSDSMAKEYSGDDDLFMTLNNHEFEDRVWPSSGNYISTKSQKTHEISITHHFSNGAASFKLWDYDWGSKNDEIGEILLRKDEAILGENTVFVYGDKEEGSLYLVEFEVEKAAW